MVHVFIVGSKGIPAQYGGFETFVEHLTAGKVSSKIQYHVSCMSQVQGEFLYNSTECFNVRLPMPGAAGRILHVSLALGQVERWCKKHSEDKVIVYILGCRIGPLIILHAARLHKLGAVICCNPDGLEWKRDKWNAWEKQFLKYCESCLVCYSDLVICDSLQIEKYVQKTYPSKGKGTVYIPYGAETGLKANCEQKLQEWYREKGLKKKGYYLIVGRFVPENNYETIIREFMRSNTKRDLVMISNVEQNRFYRRLEQKTGFRRDSRIKMAGTVYDPGLLENIRREAYAYLHGHEVGGTNPSLLEALASTDLNLLLDVGFNQEVALDCAWYWNKKAGNLAGLIERADKLDEAARDKMGQACKERINQAYRWEKIVSCYEKVWLNYEFK